ncbi:hypothetical protein JOF29_002791 [Kribbella aluminosa]|uniref:Uncharacterized protein n=1 Tax=Kribbella aluminosa TaxID=416017 RepID=A0ABS4UJ72_9ACTN|nr:hypothetical protein [Kribbella aluminosa]MBP2351708.1 hypothetical protein [Kribbella aluminosa]
MDVDLEVLIADAERSGWAPGAVAAAGGRDRGEDRRTAVEPAPRGAWF